MADTAAAGLVWFPLEGRDVEVTFRLVIFHQIETEVETAQVQVCLRGVVDSALHVLRAFENTQDAMRVVLAYERGEISVHEIVEG